MRLPLPRELADTINQLISQFLTDPKNANAAALVRDVHALPLVLDMGGFYGIKPSGELIEVAWDEAQSLKEITDHRVANMALHHGARAFPQLAALEPQKNESAVTCSSCNGTGLANVPEHLQEHVLCWCGGLGWLPSAEFEMKMSAPAEAKPWWRFWRAG
jgi:hypothetical protein